MLVMQGGPEQFSLFAFGEKNQQTLNFLQDQAYNLSTSLTNAGKAFMQRGQQIFEKYNGSEAIRMAKAAIRTAQFAFQHDNIRSLDNLPAIQQAPLSMQRWIMACPEVREMYHNQRLEGYSDTYVDHYPTSTGIDHPDYRKVISGVIQECTDGNVDWVCKTYFEDDDDKQLTLVEKCDILSTWDLIKTMLKPGKEDPTSPYACHI